MMIRALSCLMFVTIFACSARAEEELKFAPLFNGKDLAGWVPMNIAPGTFTVKDGVIHSTGKPTGIMRTERQYENFVIELEWMHEKPAGNAGLFLWGAPMTAQGTPFAKGIEIQILDDAFVTGEARKENLYTGHGDVFAIHGATMKPDRPHPKGWERCLPSENRAKPAGEWNHYRVEARNGRVTLAVNGKVVSGATQCNPRKGYLCLESEGSPAQFRNIRIAELPLTNPRPEEVQPLAEEFTTLYTGVDLSGWTQHASHEKRWTVEDWILRHAGHKPDEQPLWTEKEFGDFELILDWRVSDLPPRDEKTPFKGGAKAAIQIGRLKNAVSLAYPEDEKKPGRWIRTVVRLKGGQLTVEHNGKRESDRPIAESITSVGKIGLSVATDEPMEFASIFVRELKD